MSEPRWHFGPTDNDPDPGKRWHDGCGGEILTFREGEICDRCDATNDPEVCGE